MSRTHSVRDIFISLDTSLGSCSVTAFFLPYRDVCNDAAAPQHVSPQCVAPTAAVAAQGRPSPRFFLRRTA